MQVQRVTASDQIASTRGKVALRYGPLVYNVEKVDQDIAKPLSAGVPLKAEWRGDLLGGVIAITGEHGDGAPVLAIPNYARANRDAALPPEAGPLSGDVSLFTGPNAKRPGPPGPREAPPPVVSVIWMPK